MCEILLNAIGSGNADPELDKLCWKRGDPVVVMEDGHEWGAEEGLPKFWIVKIPGVSVAAATKYVDHVYEMVADTSVLKRKRLFNVLVDDVPNWIKTAIRDTGEVTVTFQQIRNFIKNRDTGATE